MKKSITSAIVIITILLAIYIGIGYILFKGTNLVGSILLGLLFGMFLTMLGIVLYDIVNTKK